MLARENPVARRGELRRTQALRGAILSCFLYIEMSQDESGNNVLDNYIKKLFSGHIFQSCYDEKQMWMLLNHVKYELPV